MHNGSGLIVDISHEQALSTAMEQLYTDDIMRGDMRHRAILNAEQRSWDSILDLLWNCAINNYSLQSLERRMLLLSEWLSVVKIGLPNI